MDHAPKPSPKKPSKRSPRHTEEVLKTALDEALMLLKPLTDFHQSVEGALKEDIRVFWDVRIIRGEDTPFCHTTGSSSMPSLMAHKMMTSASSMIEQEIVEKIAAPLCSRLQTETDRLLEKAEKALANETDYDRDEAEEIS